MLYNSHISIILSINLLFKTILLQIPPYLLHQRYCANFCSIVVIIKATQTVKLFFLQYNGHEKLERPFEFVAVNIILKILNLLLVYPAFYAFRINFVALDFFRFQHCYPSH